jgi:hypothetical protein
MALRDEVRRATAEAERLAAAEQAARIAREQVLRALEDARNREAAAVDQAQQQIAAAEELEAECRRLGDVARQAETQAGTQREEQAQEIARLRERVQVLEGEQVRRTEEVAAASARERSAQTELAAVLQRSAAEREAAAAQARTFAESTETARAAAVAELEALRESMAEAQAIILHMEAVAALDEQGAADRERVLSHTQDVSRQNEQARAAAVAELERLRAALAAVQAEHIAARSEARTLGEELERLRAVHEERERLAVALDEARGHADAMNARVAALEPQLESLRAERTRLMDGGREQTAEVERRFRAKLAESETAIAAERQRARQAEAELEQITSELEAAVASEWRARDELSAALSRSETDREETLRQARELTATAEKARAATVGELESLRTALADQQALVLQAEDLRRQTTAELERLRSAEETAQNEQRRLAALLEEARMRDAENARARVALEAELAGAKPAAAAKTVPPAEPIAPTAPTAQPSAMPATGSGARSLLVIDVDGAWSAGEGSTLVVNVVTPTEDLSARVAILAPHRILVNLAAPGAFQAMVALRAGGCAIRFYGCIARPEDEQTLLLGPVEPAPRPADPEILVSLLTGYAPKAARIMAAGTDANTFISLRQALTRAGMSVSIAWDAKQASDLLEIVRPQALVLDLGLPPRGAHGLVAQAAAGTPPAIAVLIPGPVDPASGFLAAMLDRNSAAGTPRARAVQETLRRTDEPPATR